MTIPGTLESLVNLNKIVSDTIISLDIHVVNLNENEIIQDVVAHAYTNLIESNALLFVQC